MYHLPKIFNYTSSPKRNKLKRGGPKLQRVNAQKGIDYTPRETKSLDLDTTSFRIQGTDEGELDRVYQSLGLSGPDDLGISLLDWEARKNNLACFSGVSEVKSLDLDCCDNRVDSFNHIVRIGSHVDDCNDKIQSENEFQHVYVVKSNVGRNGIKGVRPHVLIPPVDGVPYSIPMYDMKLFVPEVGVDVDDDVDNMLIGGGRRGIKGFRPPGLMTPPDTMRYNVSSYVSDSYVPEERGGDVEDEVDNEEFGENESCSFTTNDDDSSSTTTENISPTVRTRSIDGSSARTEPPSYISPNGRVRRIVNNWTKGRLLGRGSFGSVYEGIADGGFFLAVKEVSLLDEGVQGRQSIYQLEQEISLLSKFEHENIVQYYGTYKDESTLYIFLELASKGSLLNLYQQYHLRDATASAYTRQILLGLKYLHDRNVVHRDIKCANILVDTNGTVKLADFGLAKSTNDVQSCKGTAFWMAPEVIKGSGYGLAADIWSLGCTVLEMLTSQLPYHPLECMQAVYRIGKSIPPDVPNSLSKDARDFILKCLQLDPSSRPTAAQLLDHSFVKGRLLSSSELESPHNPRRQAR
ncbi:mitogen-activated protein kinase kinase kinase 1-like [Apium graveolens]|uniref:mitogen-activated protein kinase kinase kinase 1-like n=1 Tax=Apium graveolens TaxID=4045 RepID=UPI003D78F239